MKYKTTLRFLLVPFNLRRALLAAMETCWVYAVIVFLAALMQLNASLTPLPFFIVYWLALNLGRALPRTRLRGILLQATAMLSALVCVLAVARLEIYPALVWSDGAWLPRFLANLFLSVRGITLEQIVSVAAVYVFIRGLGFGQRPLTLWFIGFQFRLGVVVFFGLFFLAAFARGLGVDQFFAPWIFVYFFLALLSIALARSEELGADFQFTPRWMATLLAAVALVLFIGLGVAQVFTVETAQALLGIFAPLWAVVALLILIVAVPLGYIIDFLFQLLKPLFQPFGQMLANLQNSPLGNFAKDTFGLQDAANNELSMNILRTILILAVLLLIGYWLVRALNKKMQSIEAETYVRESIADQAAERARRAATKKKTPPRARAHALAAETIRRIYAALVARAAAAGLPRRLAETPYEFLPRLEKHWSAEANDLRAITEAYVQAHYAEEPTTQAQASRVKAAWERIKKK